MVQLGYSIGGGKQDIGTIRQPDISAIGDRRQVGDPSPRAASGS